MMSIRTAVAVMLKADGGGCLSCATELLLALSEEVGFEQIYKALDTIDGPFADKVEASLRDAEAIK